MFTALILVALAAPQPCRISVVDRDDRWPVPLITLTTTSGVSFVTDNAGVVAFDATEFMNRETWLTVASHGYSVKADGFGYRGVKVTPTPGGSLTIVVDRDVRARRVGRITGSGLFAESQKLGDYADWPESGLTGCDSVQSAVFHDHRFWLWGDTNLPNYPLGIYHVPAATTKASPWEEAKPPLKPKFDYYRDAKQRPRGVAQLPGEGPTWLFGLANVENRLVATYIKTKGHLNEYERGLCEWNPKKESFEHVKTVWRKGEPKLRDPHGQCVSYTDGDNKKWLLFGDPFPDLKMLATYDDWQNPAKWEKVPTPTFAGVKAHGGGMGWHAWRKKYVCVFVQAGGESSYLGDLWYCESDSPFGPWSKPILIMKHNNYTFYNPMLHCGLVAADSPILLFEGTYTAEFAQNAVPTPRWNYNQVLYSLDLSTLK